MPDHDASAYGRWIADDYDAIYGGTHDTDAAIAQLVTLADGGPVLEFGIGTGRLAVPLARHDLDVHGIDGSAEMLARVTINAGELQLPTTLGDFSTVHGKPRHYALVVLAVNTIYALEDQDAQVRCFRNAAWHLRPEGRFVVEAWVPNIAHLATPLRNRTLSPGHFGLVASEHDPCTQTLATTQVVLSEDKVRVFPVVHRYAWPSELDLMAQLAGFQLEHRWADWHAKPYDATSTDHVSVYRLEA